MVVEPDVYDPALQRRYLRFMKRADLELLLMNETVPVRMASGEIEYIPKAKWWLEHPKRRTYAGGIALDPTRKLGPQYLNTWRGFAVEPCEGDPSVIVEHVLRLAAGNGPAAQGIPAELDRPEGAAARRSGRGRGRHARR